MKPFLIGNHASAVYKADAHRVRTFFEITQRAARAANRARRRDADAKRAGMAPDDPKRAMVYVPEAIEVPLFPPAERHTLFVTGRRKRGGL